jgi:hypothetical protein
MNDIPDIIQLDGIYVTVQGLSILPGESRGRVRQKGGKLSKKLVLRSME